MHYPGSPDHPDHQIASATLDGFGGMMAIELAGGVRATESSFASSRSSAMRRASAGSIHWSPSPDSPHTRTSRPRRGPQAGIPDGFLRLSIGIESANDLIGDIEQALR